MFSGIENYKLPVKFSRCTELHGTMAICTSKSVFFFFITMIAILGLYEPFTHERTCVVMTGGTAGVSVVLQCFPRCGGGIEMAIQHLVIRSLYRLEWML